MTKSEQKKALKEQRLLDAAFDLFLENGMENTTIERVARRAGLAKGTFYLYFRDRQDIAQRLVQLYADRLLGDAWRKCYPPEDGCGGLVLMSRIAEEVIDALARDRRLIGFIHSNLSFELFSRIMASPMGGEPVNMLDAILLLLEQGGVVMRNSRVAVFLIIELIAGACYQSILFENPLPIAELKPHLFRAIEGIVSHI